MVEWRPPSEKESGVKFKIAMRCVGRAGFWLLIGLGCEDNGVSGDSPS